MNKRYRSNPTTRGFIATIAVLMLTACVLTFSAIAFAAAVSYADSVEAHERRIIDRLNDRACSDTARLLADKDHFLKGNVFIPEFDCTVAI